MLNNHNVPAIAAIIESINASAPDAVKLIIVDVNNSEGWLHVRVSRIGKGRLTEYSRFLTQIERTLRAEGHDQVFVEPYHLN
jgi:hypothetical protein